MSTILPIENETLITEMNAEEKDFQTQGFIDAGKVEGSPAAFSVALENFYSTVILNSDLKEHDKILRETEIEANKKSIQEKIEIHNNKIIKISEKYLPNAEEELKQAENKLADFKINPEKYVKHDKDKFMLWFYGIMSAGLAVFLVIFYSSVVYSALFRDIKIDKYTLFNSIFYPQSLEEAFTKGFTSFILVLFSAFIPMSLGLILEYMKSKRNESKFKYWPIVFGFGIFLADALLAFHISDRIYNSKALNSYGNVQPYTLVDAIQDANFWLIIFLGFITYLIFGKMFSLYNEERKNNNAFQNFENMLIEKIQNLKTKIVNYKNEIVNLEKEINALQLLSAETINLKNKVFFSVHEIRKIMSEYALGWMKFLTNAKATENEISKIEDKLNTFINNKGLDNDK